MKSGYIIAILASSFILIIGGSILRFFTDNVILCTGISMIGYSLSLFFSTIRLKEEKKMKKEKRNKN